MFYWQTIRSRMNFATVILCTPVIRAMPLLDILFFNSSRTRVSFLLSFTNVFFLPIGRPSILPSAFIRNKASLVRLLDVIQCIINT